MIKTILLGLTAFVFSFLVMTGFVSAQTATPTATPTTTITSSPTPTTSAPGAPNTGFGN